MFLFAAVLLLSLPQSDRTVDRATSYAGTWSSNNGGDGKLHLSIRRTPDGWDCKLAYSIGDQPEINAQNFSCAVDGTKLKGRYEVETDGGTAKIALEAVMSGISLEGTYSELGPDGKPADAGKWKVTAAQ
jgi:hypothetical protein